MYKIKKSDTNHTILKPSISQKIIFLLLLIISIPTFFAGLIILISEASQTSYILTGVGIAFFSAALIMKDTQQFFPTEIEFNNTSATMKLKHQKGAWQIPYSEIESISTVQQGNNGPIIFIKRKDGSFIDLIAFGSTIGKKHDEILDTLRKNIDLYQDSTEEIHDMQWYTRTVENDKITFQWKDTISIKRSIIVILLLSGFSLAFGSVSPIILYIMTALSSVLFLYLIYSQYRSFKKESFLVISKEGIKYGYGTDIDVIKSNQWIPQKEIPFEKIADSRYSMDLSSGDYLCILILDQEGMRNLSKIRSGEWDLSQIISMVKKNQSLFRISPQGKSIPQLICLESSIKQDIKSMKL